MSLNIYSRFILPVLVLARKLLSCLVLQIYQVVCSALKVKESPTLKTGHLFFLLFALVLTYSAKAQPSVKICTWKNGAIGCYNVIHDDYGSTEVPGIVNYADTMWYNRGLKFTFGAITHECEANGSYAKAKQMIEQHGHEIINHSHTHSCPLFSSDCGAGPNTDYGWAEPGATLKFNVEIDTSTASITRYTGYTPRFFIYPYDLFNESANDYLKSRGYIGARNRPYNQAAPGNFTPDAQNFFHVPLVVDIDPASNLATNLNTRVDEAINNGTWVNRELHNVGNTGWGRVSVNDYRAHLDYVKSKVDAGLLWVGTISEILTYRMQRIVYTPVASVSSNTITVNWNAAGNISIPNYLAPLQFKSPITLEVSIASYPCISNVTQNGHAISDRFIKNNKLYINVYPHLGPVVITTASTSTTNASVCSSQLPYSWNGQNYNAAGTYEVTLTNAAGCDSIATLNLIVKAASTSTTNTSVCSSQLPYSWNGQTYNAAGTYSVTLTNASGCDSIATLNLIIKAASTSTTNASVCSSQLPYSWNGQTYNAAGTYSVTLTNAAGCDSIATLNLGVKAASTSTTNTSVCSSQLPYNWNGQTYNASGTYSVTLTNAAGCDSIATLNLTVNPTSPNGTMQTISFPVISNKSWDMPDFAPGATASSGLPVTYTSSNTTVAIIVAGQIHITGIGSTNITASQAGNCTYREATSVSRILVVTKAAQTINFPNISSKRYKDPDFDLAATSSSALPVSYTSSNAAVATIVNNLVHITGVGSVTITAQQAGNSNYNAAAPVSRTLVVLKALQLISFPPISNGKYNGPSIVAGAVSSSGLPIVYTSSNTNIVTVSSTGKLTILKPGTVMITANQIGNAYYEPAPAAMQPFNALKGDQVVIFPAIANQQVGKTIKLQATAPVDPTFSSSNPQVAKVHGNTLALKQTGTVTITATAAANAFYNEGIATRTITIVPGYSHRAAGEVVVQDLEKQTLRPLKFYPNPVAHKGILEFVAVDEATSRILILDQLGRVAMEMQQQVHQGVNAINISTAQLKAGTYYLQLLVNDQVYKTKFMKAE